MLETWIRDFNHAARSLRRAPGFTLRRHDSRAGHRSERRDFQRRQCRAARPLPFPNADRLVHIGGTAPGPTSPTEFGVADELYFEYRESVPGIEDIALYGTGSSTTRAEGQVDQLFLTQATPSFFTTLGAQPLHGRLPNDQDTAPVVVISHWLWQSWFGSNPEVIGKSYSFAGPDPRSDRHHEAGVPFSGRADRVLGPVPAPCRAGHTGRVRAEMPSRA